MALIDDLRAIQPTTGRQWEIALEAMHRIYRRDRIALIFKTEPRKSGQRFVEKAPPDFVGGVRGRLCTFDAKLTKASAFPLKNIKPHQAMALESCHLQGGVAFIALWMVREGQGYVVPWEALGPAYKAWRVGSGRASVDAAWLAEHAAATVGADWVGSLDP